MRTIFILAILVLALGLMGCTKEVAVEPEAMEDDSMEHTGDAMEGDAMEDAMEESGEAMEGDAMESDDLFAGEGDISDEVMETAEKFDLPADISQDTDNFEEVSCADVDGTLTISVQVTNSGDRRRITGA